MVHVSTQYLHTLVTPAFTVWLLVGTLLPSLAHGVTIDKPIAEFPDRHLRGGVLQSAIRDEDACKVQCARTTWCLALDFDYNTLTCWFHGANTVCETLKVMPRAKHFKFIECYKDAHLLGGTKDPDARDVIGCLSRCQVSAECHSVDFDVGSGGVCWLHSAQSQSACGGQTLPKSRCNHYKLQTCVAPAALQPTPALATVAVAVLQNVVEQHQNAHIVGGARIAGVLTWMDCVRSCTGTCQAVDFDNNDLSCWHHFGQKGCSPPNAHRLNCFHYKMRGCERPVNDPPQPVLPPPALVPVMAPRPPPSRPLPTIPGVTSCGRPSISPIGSRIIGGDDTRPNSWPWQVALRNINARSSRCAGTLISPMWVLTTAHCVDQDPVPSNWFVLAGAHDLLQLEATRAVHAVSRIVIHEGFDLNTFDNDIALLRLSVAVQFSPQRSAVCLPPPDSILSGGTQCVITGWGVAANGKRPLKQAAVPVVPLSTCRRPDWLGSEFSLTDNMMCAGYEHGGVDTCQGDSGGPLVCFLGNHWVQAGVTSFGRGCGMPQKPGVYTRVSKYVTWMHNVINTF